MKAISILGLAFLISVTWLTTPTHAQTMREKMKGNYASINGLKMYYEVHGPAKNTPLVLLHGGGSTIETTFGRILPLLTKNRRVIAFEQQGHGHTADIADRPFTFEQSADDAAALLQFLKIEKADFLGFSNGGSIALQIAIRHPSLIRKLIVASAPVKRDGFPPGFFDGFKGATLHSMPAMLREAYLKTAPHPEQLQTFFDKSVRRMTEFKDVPSEDIRAIKAETLIISGDADVGLPEHNVEMFRLFSHARLAIIPGGHGAYLGADEAYNKGSKLPDLTAAMVEEFLDAINSH
jgi:pimeloyl-ACP methyl ester carboxylesterase